MVEQWSSKSYTLVRFRLSLLIFNKNITHNAKLNFHFSKAKALYKYNLIKSLSIKTKKFKKFYFNNTKILKNFKSFLSLPIFKSIKTSRKFNKNHIKRNEFSTKFFQLKNFRQASSFFKPKK